MERRLGRSGPARRCDGAIVFDGGFGELVEYLFRSQKFPNGAILLTGTGIVPPDTFTLQASDKIEFTFTAKSLPWVLPPEGDDGRKLIASAYKKPPALSSELLAIRGLAPGRYELKIDGASVVLLDIHTVKQTMEQLQRQSKDEG